MSKMQDNTMSVKLSKLPLDIKIAVGVWNLQGLIPPSNSIKAFINSIIYGNESGGQPDIICIATQQCQRSIGMSFFCQDKGQWENQLSQSTKKYQLVDTVTMRALHTAILVRKQRVNYYSTQKKNLLKAGTCNLAGNKGAISIVVNLLGQSFQFINCHLQAHQDQFHRRNQILIKITNDIAQQEQQYQVFICGDLNYRIDMTHQQYYNFVKDKNNTDEIMLYSKMLQRDQLTKQQQLKQKFFNNYKEMAIKFPPTYKLNSQNKEYDRRRIPGWTDRIFHRKGRVKQNNYRCQYDILGTDHRPVIGCFQIETQENLTLFPDQYVVVKSRSKCAIF